MSSSDICIKHLAEFDGDLKRLDELGRNFTTEFGVQPHFFVKVPGRYGRTPAEIKGIKCKYTESEIKKKLTLTVIYIYLNFTKTC